MGYKFITFSPKYAFLNMVCILALFGLATVLATFQTLGKRFSNFLVTLEARIIFLVLNKDATMASCTNP